MNHKELLYEAEVKKKVIQEQIVLLRGQYDSQIQIIVLLKEEIEKKERVVLLAARQKTELANKIRDEKTQDPSKGYVLGRAAVARKRPVNLDDDFDEVRVPDPQTRMRLID